MDYNVIYDTNVSEDKKTITFTSKYLKSLGDISVLDYEVTNYSSAIKNNNGSADYWRLRTANSDANESFINVEIDGSWSSEGSYPPLGIFPAFRIA